jgi:uncharacterized protein YjbI with pentapeptide repeats
MSNETIKLPARAEALSLLRGGSLGISIWNRVWQAWTEQQKPIAEHVEFDLSRIDLSGLDLSDVDLSFVNLAGANLRRCICRRSHFFRADFREADLTEIIALLADFRCATFDQATMERSVFTKCDLRYATFMRATMPGAVLIGSDLSETHFNQAILKTASFHHSVMTLADLTGANLDMAGLWNTHLVDMNLGPLSSCDLVHDGPSHVDWRSILKSVHVERLTDLLVATGMPELLATNLVQTARSYSDTEKVILLQTTFISYGGPDLEFARKLHTALTSAGVVTFFFPEDAQPGTRLSSMMNRGVYEYDRVILVCSKNSLQRPGVRNEIQLTLDREAREGGSNRLIPIALDDCVYTNWWPDRPENSRAVLDRVIADFRVPEAFASSLSKLLTALRRIPNGI